MRADFIEMIKTESNKYYILNDCKYECPKKLSNTPFFKAISVNET